MIKIQSDKTDYFTFNNLSKFENVKHFVSVNYKKHNSKLTHDFDLSFNTGKSTQDIIENRRILSETIGISLENFVMQDQIHSDVVKIITEEHKGLGIYNHTRQRWHDYQQKRALFVFICC